MAEPAMNSDSSQYKVVFSGQLLAGIDRVTFLSRLSKSLGVPSAVTEQLFQEQPVLVKNGISRERADTIATHFEKAGGRCLVLDVGQHVPPPQVETRPVPSPVLVTPGPTNPAPEPAGTLPPVPPVPGSANRADFSFRSPPPKKKKTPLIIGAVVVVVILFALLGRNNLEYSPEAKLGNSKSNTTRGLVSRGRQVYTDPKGYYSVQVPNGFTHRDSSSGQRSKRTFVYSRNTTLTILASPMRRRWNPQEEMDKKLDAIRSGRVAAFRGFEITESGLVDVNGLDGYEFVMERGDNIAHAFALVSLDQVAFSVSIVTGGTYSRENHETLASAVFESLRGL